MVRLRASRLRRDRQDLQEETNHGLPVWALVTPARWDWQKKSKNLTSLLAEFLFLPSPFALRMHLSIHLCVLISVI
jgi:hypothetical protein